MDADNYFKRLAAAYVRGMAMRNPAVQLPEEFCDMTLNDLSPEALRKICVIGLKAGLRIHKFKRTMGLRRVNRVLGILKGIGPQDLLDVGSGRGAFLWPLLDAFPELPVTCIDRNAVRIDELDAVRSGGIDRLSAQTMSVTAMTFADHAFDVVTFLEVLEHIENPQAALNEAMRVARRFVIVSVPSKEDDNPEHIHVFSREALQQMFVIAGATSTTFDFVLNHLIAVARVRS